MNKNNLNIPHRIKNLRESKGLSKNQLAKLAEISQSYISDLEAGKKNPTIDILDRIAKALETPLTSLISDPTSETLPSDLIQLLETAKKLSPEEREALTRYLQVRLKD
ncbi:MAG TPA: helix-turn-helix domain-containing protein [Bacillales bacterium]|nr:helix-turn-helix domain-containing protein [Bacillales bacterium]